MNAKEESIVHVLSLLKEQNRLNIVIREKERRLLLPSVHKTVVYTGQSTALQRDGWIDGRRGWLVTAGESEQKVMLSLLPLY